MFIISFLWALVELGLVIGMAGYAYIDYRRGGPTAKMLLEKAVDIYDGLGFGSQSGVKRARRIVREHAKNLAMLQQAVARVATNVERARAQEMAQLKLAADYRLLLDEAVSQEMGDVSQALMPIEMSTSKFLPSTEVFAGTEAQKVAVLAARAEAEVEIRGTMYRKTAERQEVVLRQLQDKLADVEIAYESLRTDAETIEISADSAAADRMLYALVSEVSIVTGLTPRGELAELKEDTERSRIEAGKLVEMAQRSNVLETVMAALHVSKVVADKIEAAKQRVNGLLSPMMHVVANGNNGKDDDVLCVTEADYRVEKPKKE